MSRIDIIVEYTKNILPTPFYIQIYFTCFSAISSRKKAKNFIYRDITEKMIKTGTLSLPEPERLFSRKTNPKKISRSIPDGKLKSKKFLKGFSCYLLNPVWPLSANIIDKNLIRECVYHTVINPCVPLKPTLSNSVGVGLISVLAVSAISLLARLRIVQRRHRALRQDASCSSTVVGERLDC